MSTQERDSQKLSFTLSDFTNWPVFAFAMEVLTNDEKNKCWAYLGGPAPAAAAADADTLKKRAMKLLMKNISKEMLSLILDKKDDPRGAWKLLETKGIGGAGVKKQNVTMLIMDMDREQIKPPLTLEEWNRFYKSMLDLNRKIESWTQARSYQRRAWP